MHERYKFLCQKDWKRSWIWPWIWKYYTGQIGIKIHNTKENDKALTCELSRQRLGGNLRTTEQSLTHGVDLGVHLHVE